MYIVCVCRSVYVSVGGWMCTVLAYFHVYMYMYVYMCGSMLWKYVCGVYMCRIVPLEVDCCY